MRSCAFADLDQLDDDRLFRTLSRGLTLIQANATAIVQQAATLATQQQVTGPRILRAIGDEEAGKFLILMDAARCPRNPPGTLGRHLRKLVGVNAHLAKGIYAESSNGLMGTLGAHREWIQEQCKAYYLDGPNDVDWIFRNQILQRREEAIYVDYVENDGDHSWWSPSRYETGTGAAFGLDTPSRAIRLIDAMVAAGMTSPEALTIIAARWRGITLSDDLQHFRVFDLNRETLQMLVDARLVQQQEGADYQRIIEAWPSPLHDIDIRLSPDNQQELRERQARWYPGPV